jgi:hypothetical protein
MRRRATLVDLELDQVVQIAHEAPALALGDLRDLLCVTRDRGELERAEQDRERGQRRGIGGDGHAATSRTDRRCRDEHGYHDRCGAGSFS